MKNLVLAVFVLGTVIFGGLYSRQRVELRKAGAKIATLSQSVLDMESQLAERDQQRANLQERLQTTRAKVVAKVDEVAQLQQAITNQAGTTTNKGGNPLAEMFKTPEMREMIKTQQKTVLGTMFDKSYGAYFKTLQMTPDQATALKDLIMKKSMVDANAGISLLTGENDLTKRKEVMDQAKTDKEGIDQQIKQFLGDDNYTQFQSYEKTIPERMSLSMYKDQHSSGPGALTPDQEEALAQAMSAERQQFKFTTDFNDQSKFNGDFASMFTEERMNQFASEREQLDQQYLARANSILAPEQLGPFSEFLTSQRNMQTAAMKMAGKMFGAKSGGQ